MEHQLVGFDLLVIASRKREMCVDKKRKREECSSPKRRLRTLSKGNCETRAGPSHFLQYSLNRNATSGIFVFERPGVLASAVGGTCMA